MASKEQRGLLVPHLEAWRRFNAPTQRELATRAGVARGTIVRGEDGEPISAGNVRKLAEALDISVQQLMYEMPSTQPTGDEPRKMLPAA
jgi:transcriptional regulator with XRE-family HTH domain